MHLLGLKCQVGLEIKDARRNLLYPILPKETLWLGGKMGRGSLFAFSQKVNRGTQQWFHEFKSEANFFKEKNLKSKKVCNLFSGPGKSMISLSQTMLTNRVKWTNHSAAETTRSHHNLFSPWHGWTSFSNLPSRRWGHVTSSYHLNVKRSAVSNFGAEAVNSCGAFFSQVL